MSVADWLQLALLHLSHSLLAVGGAMTLAPALHRSLVGEHAWLSDAQFQACITLAQATPGPNVLYIALVGWTIGLQAVPGAPEATRLLLGALGLGVCLVGVLLPSSLLAAAAGHWLRQRQHWRGVQAFRQGMAPVVVGVMLATAWLLGRGLGLWQGAPAPSLGLALALLSTLAVWRTRIGLVWLIAGGALAGVWLG